MHWIVIICAAIAYVLIVSAKTTALTVICLAILTYIAGKTAHLVTGAEVRAADSLRSIGLAWVFMMLFFTVAYSAGRTEYSWGTTTLVDLSFNTPTGIATLSGFLLAYTAGFKVGMDVHLGSAVLVGLVTVVSTVVLLTAALIFV